ncbi:hypothetical protein [Streptococcus pluranimalium]|uniref:hypothetical protein n=1 Tax=Streptococcus pluranimalium TaxID=82348 RepID=UPI003F68EDA6
MNKFPFKEVGKRLEELNGLTLEEMLDVLGADRKKFGALHNRLYEWRRNGKISFVCKNKRFHDLKLIDNAMIADLKKEQGLTELSRWKIRRYVMMAYEAENIYTNPAVKAKERNDAMTTEIKVLKHLENDYAWEIIQELEK